jgi:hypothetical protein
LRSGRDRTRSCTQVILSRWNDRIRDILFLSHDAKSCVDIPIHYHHRVASACSNRVLVLNYVSRLSCSCQNTARNRICVSCFRFWVLCPLTRRYIHTGCRLSYACMHASLSSLSSSSSIQTSHSPLETCTHWICTLYASLAYVAVYEVTSDFLFLPYRILPSSPRHRKPMSMKDGSRISLAPSTCGNPRFTLWSWVYNWRQARKPW